MPMDSWVLAGMRAHGLKPSPDADRGTLGRRLSFDLIGLPPTLEELEKFELDPAPDGEAVARFVDRLLASPRFGEHWARRWMDISRFAESVTLRGLIFKEAWRYRDYLVDSFNRDVPIDRLIREQIAGDLLPATTVADASRQLIATTFLMLGNSNLEEQDKLQLEMDVIDEQLDVIGKAFLGQTIGCARCHDHKFDPLTIRDYYAMAGVFRNIVSLRHDNVSAWVERPLPLEPLEAKVHQEHEAQISSLQSEIESLRRKIKSRPKPAVVGKNESIAAASTTNKTPVGPAYPGLDLERSTLQTLEARLKQLTASGPVRPKAMAPLESSNIVDTALLKRGSVHSPAGIVPRGFPVAIAPVASAPIPSTQSGRLELAEWIVSPAQTLTRRVLVNRFWLWMFGEGLVRTPDNFGTTGEAPTHPELLDTLGARFGRATGDRGGMGWSVKTLLREMALSRTYRQRAALPSANDPDPENRYWSRATRKPLTAEQLRDAMLFLGGGVDFTVPQGAGFPLDRGADYGFEGSSDQRSVYLPQFRNALPEFVAVFDGAHASLVTGRRDRSSVAPQALFLLNHEWVLGRARRAAELALREGPPAESLENRLIRLHRQVLSRQPSQRELTLGSNHFNQSESGSEAETEAWAAWIHALFASIDFRTLQ